MVALSEDVKKRERDVRPYIEEYAELFEIDPNLVRALITQESRFIANAVSPTGAVGYGQFTGIGAKQVQNIAAMTPKAADLKNFTKQDADDANLGIKAICATLWWLYYRKYPQIEDKKLRLEACLTFYNAGGKAAALVIEYGGHAQAVPAIKQLPSQYRSQADKYASEVFLWFVAWHDFIEAEKKAAAKPIEVPPVLSNHNPFDGRVKKIDVRYKALVEALKLLADEDKDIDILFNTRDGMTELTLIFPGEI